MALLAQNQNHHHVKPLNSKVKRLQLMLEIRRLVLDGHSYSEIQEVLGIPRRSFYRLLDRVFQHDKRVLEAQNTQQVIFQLALLESRDNSIFQELASIGRDNSQNAADRMNALAAMAELSRTIAKLHHDAPIISVLQAKKLKAIKDRDIPLYWCGESGSSSRTS